MARGRKSAASLTVMPVIPGVGRPKPPRHLDALERQVWRAIVDALPAHWLDAAGCLILRRAVTQAVTAERHEVKLRALRASGEDDVELVRQHAAAARSLGQLLTLLRATPRARMVPRAAGPQVENAPKTRPWEVKARG